MIRICLLLCEPFGRFPVKTALPKPAKKDAHSFKRGCKGPVASARQLYQGWHFAMVLLVLGSVNFQRAMAHGELHLRIVELTRKIDAAGTNRARLYLERGELYREHGDFEAAEADYTRAAKADPNLAAVDFCRGRLLAAAGRLEAACEMFDKGLNRSPAEGEGYIGRGRVLLALGERENAIADYRRGLELVGDPEPAWFLELARALEAEKEIHDALQVLDSGVARFGPTIPLQGYALELELARANTNAALARLDTILANSLRKESWFARRGDLLLGAGRVAEAEQSFRAAEAALKSLPPRLQQSPSMTNLLARIHTCLAAMASSPVAPASEPPSPGP